eukprot:365817-Chlamydomonas_euryale.AAC.32
MYGSAQVSPRKAGHDSAQTGVTFPPLPIQACSWPQVLPDKGNLAAQSYCCQAARTTVLNVQGHTRPPSMAQPNVHYVH